MRNLSSVAVLGLAVVYLAAACGSEDDKKKDQGSKYNAGGDDTNAGGGSLKPDAGASASDGGSEPTGGTNGTDGGTTSTDGGATGTDGGTTMTGDAGSGGVIDDRCEPGYRECDGDLSTMCEQNINLITACGDCTTKCMTINGVPTCNAGKCEFACADGFADCDGDGANGCEVTLATDAKHCGSCERNCQVNGATCGAGACSVVQMQQNLASGTESWTFSPLGLFHVGFYNYSVRRMPLEGQGVLTLWAPTNKTSPTESVLVVGDDIYWAERGSTEVKFSSVVYKKPINAAANVLPTPVFAPEYAATYLKRQGNALYWASGGYQEGFLEGFIYTRALDAAESDPGTAIMTVNQGAHGSIRQLGVTSNALYWVTTQATGTTYELRTAPLAGSPVSVVPAVFPSASLAITNYYRQDYVALISVGQYVYFNRDVGDAYDGVYRYKTGMEKPEQIAAAAAVNSLQVDDEYVYFTQGNVLGVWRAPINDGAGGAAEQITKEYSTIVVGVDDTFVYVLYQGNGYSLYKVIK